MTEHDLSHTVEPWLAELHDDPDNPVATDLPTTSFPLGGEDLEGNATGIDVERVGFPLQNVAPSDEDVQAGRAAHRESGIDVLAFYKSFRFRDRAPFRDKWGIFLIDAGVGAVEAEFAELSPGLPPAELQKLAIDTLLAHERYHFWVDAWALGQELLPYSSGLEQATLPKRYEYYLAARRKVEMTAADFEESLANHYAYLKLRDRTLSDGTKADRLVASFFAASPAPYSKFDFDPTARARTEAGVARSIVHGAHGTDPLGSALCMSGPILGCLGASMQPREDHPAVGYRQCPIQVVTLTDYATRVSPFQGPQLKEFQRFIERYLAGEKIEASDHQYYRIDNGEKVKFPNPHDKNVRDHELKGTLRKAGMTQSDFNNARRLTSHWKKNCPREHREAPLKT